MDQIANLLISIKNGGLVKKDYIFVPYSKIKENILKVLKAEGFIKTFEIVELGSNKKSLRVVLNYEGRHPNIRSKINGVERVSKLSKRIYVRSKDIKLVKHGQGLAVLSTPKGILTGREARKEMVGGEILFNIW